MQVSAMKTTQSLLLLLGSMVIYGGCANPPGPAFFPSVEFQATITAEAQTPVKFVAGRTEVTITSTHVVVRAFHPSAAFQNILIKFPRPIQTPAEMDLIFLAFPEGAEASYYDGSQTSVSHTGRLSLTRVERNRVAGQFSFTDSNKKLTVTEGRFDVPGGTCLPLLGVWKCY
jgi:hypothetical protein